MTRINALSWEFRSVCFLQRLQARKWNNFAIVIVVLIFVLNENIGNFLPVCNAGLLHDLTLGVSHNNYHKYIFIHVVSIIFRFSRGLKFRGLKFRALSFRGLKFWGLKFRGLSFRDTPEIGRMWICFVVTPVGYRVGQFFLVCFSTYFN